MTNWNIQIRQYLIFHIYTHTGITILVFFYILQGILETFVGLGMSVGPAIGGLLSSVSKILNSKRLKKIKYSALNKLKY